MTVSSIEPVNNYAGNSSNTRFDFDFLIEDENELKVQHTSSNGTITVLTNGIDYTIHETGNKNGSYITFPILGSNYHVLTGEEKISLMLTLTVKQEKEIRNSLFFNFDTLEWMFDYVIRILQIMTRRLTRTLQIPEGRNDFNMVLPIAKANNVFKWNETEDAIENYDIIGANNSFQAGVNADLLQYKTETSQLVSELSTISNTALETANSAISTAGTASSNSSIALSNSASALQIANTSSTNASTALSNANTALSNSVTALNTANEANNKVDTFGTEIETVLEAAEIVNTFEEAVTTATTAATTASNAANTATQKAQEAVQAAATFVKSDWNVSDTSSMAYILNKPSALSDFTDDLGNSPTHTHSQYLTQHQDISGKEDKLKSITVLNTSGTIILEDGSINSITPSASVTFTLPAITDNTKFHQILVQINLSTVVSVNVGTSNYFNNQEPDMSEIGTYDIIYEYDKAANEWIVGVISKVEN